VTILTLRGIIAQMIRSFRNRDTERVWNGRRVRRWSTELQAAALIKLHAINAALDVMELREPPSNRLEALHGNRAGQWSIRINRQWRICFEWQATYADNVEIVDYH
jgi:proteic killer suppression protein